MSAREPAREPRDGLEAAVLRLSQQLPPREQRAYLGTLLRRLDGQPLADAFVELFVELGDPPAMAKLKVADLFRDAGNWRETLN